MKHSADAPVLDPSAVARLDRFVALLRRWNARINLIARADEAEIWERHIADSAQLAPLLPVLAADDADDVIDLGSGAGFPGLVLAVVTGRRVHLVEADQRKAAFLREAVRETAANAIVHAGRAESLVLPQSGTVTARALAPLTDLLDLAAPRLRPDGICLFPKGRMAEAELTQARRRWQMQVERFASRTSPEATIFRLREVVRAPSTE